MINRNNKNRSVFLLAYPYQFWNSFAFPSTPSSSSAATATAASTRRFNIPSPLPPPLSIPPFHSNAASVLSHSAAAAAACMHPAFNYMFNRPDIMSKASLMNHQSNFYNSHQQQSTRNREISASSSSSSASSYGVSEGTSGSLKSLL